MRAAIYLRVSTDDQAESGAGLKAQADACLALAAREGWDVVGSTPDEPGTTATRGPGHFADEGVSGGKSLGERPALMAALDALDDGGGVLLVAKRDRLGRDPIVVAMIEARAAKLGVRIVSAAGEGTEGNDPSNVLMRRMIDAFAEYERLIIKARTRAALRAKQHRGERTGRVPFGFDLCPVDPRRSKGGNPIALVPNPAEQAIVLEIRAQAAAGITPARIAADLRARGVPTKTGAPWSNMAVRRILERSGRAAG